MIYLIFVIVFVGATIAFVTQPSDFSEPGRFIDILIVSIIFCIGAVYVNNCFGKTTDSIVKTSDTYLKDNYKVTKDNKVYISSKKETKIYPYEIKNIEYSGTIDIPTIEWKTTKSYGDVNFLSKKFHSQKTLYETRINKITFPKKALPKNITAAKVTLMKP